ncbi:MAG: hypothetical protein EKK33_32715 [Bradyrhizobiaceae bacterium]|nr:MAG: hypothetical protein EKK33_32715 [Bradyrhizobiaceae bacterium]
MRIRTFFRVVVVTIGLGGCGWGGALNPPRLVSSGETDTSIQLFIQASILMLHAYGFRTVPYEEIQFRSERAGFQTLPFVPPPTIKATPQLIAGMSTASVTAIDTKPMVKYYIRTGLRAAQLICRNHLTRLDEGNQYLEFVKREIGVASTFTTAVLALVNANATLSKSFLIATTGINDGLNAFEDYRYLTIDRDVARNLVETAQNKYAEFFLNQVDQSSFDNNVTVGGYTFSDALNAVSTIEYQCTREGIRFLLNRSINNTPSNMEIDAGTGTVIFKSAKNTTNGTGVGAAALISNSNTRLQLLDPAPPDPGAISDTRLTKVESQQSSETITMWQAKVCAPAPHDGKLGKSGSATRAAIMTFLGKKAGESDALNRKDVARLNHERKRC